MIICTNPSLWPGADPSRIQPAAEAAAERFHFHGLSTRLDSTLPKGLLRPYNYFATDEYFGNESAFREAADVFVSGVYGK